MTRRRRCLHGRPSARRHRSSRERVRVGAPDPTKAPTRGRAPQSAPAARAGSPDDADETVVDLHSDGDSGADADIFEGLAARNALLATLTAEHRTAAALAFSGNQSGHIWSRAATTNVPRKAVTRKDRRSDA